MVFPGWQTRAKQAGKDLGKAAQGVPKAGVGG